MSNQTQEKSALEAIIYNYLETEKSLVAQLNFQVPDHPPTIGGFREEIWKQLFEQIVPKKYVIEQSVFLMDSNGEVSDEVDLAIFDEMYTPYIFRNGRIKFIPIEAVAAVVQCKSNIHQSKKTIDNLRDWCASISKLQTASNSIARFATSIITPDEPNPTQQSTRPIKILCYLSTTSRKNKAHYIHGDLFDFEIIANNKQQKITVLYPEDKTLLEWFNELNNRRNKINYQEPESSERDPIIKFSKSMVAANDLKKYSVGNTDFPKGNVSLLSFNFQFNQLLMLINNPMLFPHAAYAEMFRKVYKSMPEKSEKSTSPQKR